MKILVSACLLGVPCRWDGAAKPDADVIALLSKHELIPVCPEQLGGLSTPRPCVELRAGRAVTASGGDATDAFERGAQIVLQIARLYGCDAALLKAKSPSCGVGRIYDGTFSRVLCPGDGLTARLLRQAGLALYTEADLGSL